MSLDNLVWPKADCKELARFSRHSKPSTAAKIGFLSKCLLLNKFLIFVSIKLDIWSIKLDIWSIKTQYSTYSEHCIFCYLIVDQRVINTLTEECLGTVCYVRLCLVLTCQLELWLTLFHWSPLEHFVTSACTLDRWLEGEQLLIQLDCIWV